MTKKELDHKYYLAVKDTPEYKARRTETQRKYRQSHLEFVRKLNREWIAGFAKRGFLMDFKPSAITTSGKKN